MHKVGVFCVIVALQFGGMSWQRTTTVDCGSHCNGDVHHLSPKCDRKCGIIFFAMREDVFSVVHAVVFVDGMEMMFESPVTPVG